MLIPLSLAVCAARAEWNLLKNHPPLTSPCSTDPAAHLVYVPWLVRIPDMGRQPRYVFGNLSLYTTVA